MAKMILFIRRQNANLQITIQNNEGYFSIGFEITEKK